jgi:hypothetical protein
VKRRAPPSPEQRARAELWQRICEQRTANALAADRARVEAEVAKMVRLREQRLAKAKHT